MSFDANRGFVCLDRHQPYRRTGLYADTTFGFYALRYEVVTPAWAFDRHDPSLARELYVLDLRHRRGEPLVSPTPA